jgi:hypothetical protein
VSVLVAGVSTTDRVRGSGWLDCPACGEHTAQDVVDEMRFASFLGYRLTPVGRRRLLVCRRCGYRREASASELASLRTGGRSIRRAWMLPVGLLPLLIAGILALVLVTRHTPSIEDVIAFTNDTAQPVAPISLRRPLTWNASPNTDATPPAYTVTDPTQTMIITLRRITDSTTLVQLIARHYADDTGINSTGVPTSPPAATPVRLAGENGLRVRFTDTALGANAQTTVYAVFHDGIGYTLSYVADGSNAISTLDQVADTVNRSLRFVAAETPAPCPSAAASPPPSPEVGTPTPSGSSPPTLPLPSFATSPQPCAVAGPAGTATGAAAPPP